MTKGALTMQNRTRLALFTGLVVVSSLPSGATRAATPDGFHDAWEGVVGPSHCRAEGWAVDPDDRLADLNIRIWADGVQVADGVANLFRQDLIDAGVSPDGLSGFDINLLGLVTPDQPHVVTAQAQDAQTREWVDLNDTPKELTCSSINETPIGTHDAWEGMVGPARCTAEGWAVDPNDRYVDLNIRILVDEVQVANGVADLFRQDLIDAGVSPDGFSGFSFNLWGLLTLNESHVVRAQAQDAQTNEWVDVNLTPKGLTCAGTVPDPADIVNPKLSFFTAECAVQGIVDVTAVVSASGKPVAGGPRTFNVVGENKMFIVYTPGTDRRADDFCVFGWTGGWEPTPPWNRAFGALVFVAPKKK